MMPGERTNKTFLLHIGQRFLERGRCLLSIGLGLRFGRSRFVTSRLGGLLVVLESELFHAGRGGV